ncbi:NDP-hexose 2,3-dehydratase family protein [Actinokineospora sp. UTMC 2448]|uniref:NDP-hexose 2,3-dehydratase family protein n=1 Tax=Actinokineospora sp. UTMC 2448 TaxID=2268449 RepID=UPI002164AB40|nr:NDP-hexose 2,3-dehydratase family protein [Actinokineospora sp. UTMC 2448]UVS78692.1 TDP-4-keto-6-deoxy-D-glucose-2,3-dehydratase PerS10 [Actinokineospora sp. UTMC 2448]
MARSLLYPDSPATAVRLAESVWTPDSPRLPSAQFPAWLAERAAATEFAVAPIPFERARGWGFDERTGDLRHASGRFFAVEGLAVASAQGDWEQPIIVQPEIGILGIVVKEFDGVLHCLMQAKVEPGNVNGVQLSPTVQATHSNYTRVHQGREIPYLELFTRRANARVLVDVLQSEQGSWFLHKRNRNMVVEVTEDIPTLDDFCWLTLGQLQAMLRVDNLVNMDARTVLSCLPFARPGAPADADPFVTALTRSLDPALGARHRDADVRSWFTEAKTRSELTVRRRPLDGVAGWSRDGERIGRADGRHFQIIAVDVTAGSREVSRWSQPLLAPAERGVVAFLARRFDGVLHFLVHARVQHGYLDRVEMAPTVQCLPGSHPDPAVRPRFLDYLLGIDAARIRYDVLQSEEGGRFHHAVNRYVVAEVDADFPAEVPPDYLWVALHQLIELLRHSHYLNVEARSLVTCLHSLW